jgi:membrane protease YdiL (CAAX protease family)
MKTNGFSLVKHPWLFLLVYILATILSSVTVSVFLIGILKLSGDEPITDLWVMMIVHCFMVFVLVPFVIGMRDRSQPYKTYLSEIRVTNWKPVLQLLILGVSSYLFFALSQVIATLIFRLSQGLAINGAFLRGSFPFASEFPPNSWGLFVSAISIFEELAFRGVVLALFLRHYNPPKAVLFSALGFGVIHAFSILTGSPPVFTAGNVVWATILGLFYGYITFKTGSLLPAMLVHYLGNLFIYPLTAYIQNNASLQVQTLYGVILTMGVIPALLMFLWARAFTTWWPLHK